MPSPRSPARRALGTHVALLLAASMIPVTAGCGGGNFVPPAAPSASIGPRPARPTPDAIWMQFRPDLPEQHWSLIGGDEKLLCTLPCAQWVPDPAAVSLEYEQPGTITVFRMGLPADVGPPGGSVVVIPRVKGGSKRLANSVLIGGLSADVAGLLLFGFVFDAHSNERLTAATALGLGFGGPGLVLTALGLYLRTASHSPDVLVRSGGSAPHSTFTLGPGFAEAESASPSGLRVVLTPFGAAGTF